MKDVKISASNILSFKYRGPHITLLVENVPLLLDVSIGYDPIDERLFYGLRNLIDTFILYFLQLETLKLHLALFRGDVMQFQHIELPKLMHLLFRVKAHGNYNLFDSTRIISVYRRKLCEVPKCPLEHLKEVEFIGFARRPIDHEIGYHFLKNALMLEKREVLLHQRCRNIDPKYFVV
ncbi:hypothetical protein Q3G72_005763 [Acer saccharum]|nr:hypothetical protein Q3G72_005763 [Acer saccharum]